MSAARAALLTFWSHRVLLHSGERPLASAPQNRKPWSFLFSLYSFSMLIEDFLARGRSWGGTAEGGSRQAYAEALVERHHVSQGLACGQAVNIRGHVTHAALERLTGDAGNVRRHEHVLEFRERIPGWFGPRTSCRIVVPDVENGAANPLFAEGLIKSLGVDEWTSASVDEHGFPFHRAKLLASDEMLRPRQ